MILSPKQDNGIQVMSNKYKRGDRITVVVGVAGAGKSTIISHFINANDLMRYTKFVTFTGKAALVLRRKGLPATTIHRLIYNAYKNPVTNKWYFTLKNELEDDVRLIIIDEVSMVPKKLLMDLATFGIPIIATGDPEQLEPIGEDNLLLKTPDVFLDEVHRQAAENTIIRLSMDIRTGKGITDYNDEYVKVLNKNDLSVPMLLWADQVLCGKNATRRTINSIVRNHFGRTKELPEIGDKVICLRNYWDFINEEEDPLINGTIGTVTKIWDRQENPGAILGDRFIADFKPDYSESEFSRVKFDPNVIKGLAPMADSLPPSMGKLRNTWQEVDYGYAITTHKSQGSEFDKVLVMEEILRRDSHKRWLYTAVTRAKEKLVLVKM